MSSNLLLAPMAIVVFYPWFLAMYQFVVRKRAIKDKSISFKYFQLYSASEHQAPKEILVLSNHYNNWFQVPVVFLITCLTFMQLQYLSDLSLVLAWSFVLFRAFHVWAHLGKNNVIFRAQVFAASWLCVLAMWVELLVVKAFQ